MKPSDLDNISESLMQMVHGRVPELLEHPGHHQPEELSRLVDAVNSLIKSYSDAQGFLIALSDGCLDTDPPVKNFLISPFKHLHAHLKHLTWQTQQVARGYLNQSVDFMGDFSIAFNSMIQSLREKRLIEAALQKSHLELKEANENILESIDYARSIQSAILPMPEKLDVILGNYFVIWNPRDVIGGDFYWIEGNADEFAFAVSDCTGHGVPGSIMTMIAATSLKHAEQEIGYRDPGALLALVNKLMRETLRYRRESSLYDDGMDMGICYVNRDSRQAIYSGAHVSLFVCSDKTGVNEIKGDNHSVGYQSSNPDYCFTNHKMLLEKPTELYLTTDGLIDQIGGSNLLPFGKNRFSQFILKNYGKASHDRRQELLEEFQAYTADENQRDDVTVFAISV